MYNYHSGTGATTINLIAGQYLSTVAAFATSAGATVTVGGGDAVPVPNPGSVTMDIKQEMQGPLAIVFTGTSGYLVDYFTNISRAGNE